MTDLDLTQAEAEALIAMPKVKTGDQVWENPSSGGALSIPLVSRDKREQFLLDVSRARIDLKRGKYQNRARQVVVLVRLDFGGAPHRNPDDQEVSCPHLHLYREGFGDKWAIPIPKDSFANVDDLWRTLLDFMAYCNVVEPPDISRGLFA